MRWSISQAVVAVASLWLAAVGLSLAGLVDHALAAPPIADFVYGATALAPLALPAGFASSLGLRIPSAQVVYLAVVYWPVMLFAHYQFMSRRRPQLLAALILFVAVSAWRWQVMAQGMLGA